MPDNDPFPDPVPLEPGPELDLHTFRPSEVGDLIPEWIEACRTKGVRRIRIVHGKGTGALREGVHVLLARLPGLRGVIWPADASEGGWGATIVELEP